MPTNAERGRSAPHPIFVIGTARSGTTWVGNLIASHPDVAAVTAPEHHGVIESHLFDHTQHALRGRLTAAQFIERYEPEDYFQALGMPAEEFVAASAEAPVDAVAHFETLMRLHATRQGARYWLEKTPRHAIYVDQIAERFPRARFVVVRRDPSRTVRGQIAAFPAPGSSHLRTVVEKALRYATDIRGVDRLSRTAGGRATVVRYEDLVRDFEGETLRLQQSLGLDPCRLHSDFERRSSGPRAEVQLPLPDRMVVSVCSRAMAGVPFALIRSLRTRRDAARGGRGPYYRRLAERSST